MIDQIFTVAFLTGFLAATIRMAAPILIASLGEMFTQRSGILNLGIEGIMLLAAFTGLTVSLQTGSLWLGFFAGGLVGALVGLLMGVLSVRFHAMQIIAGLGIWIMLDGLCSMLNRAIYGIDVTTPKITTLEAINIPVLSTIPIIGESFFNQNILVYLTLLSIPLFTYIIKETSWGLNINAVGENPRAADAAGLNVGLIRTICATFGGLMAGFAGAYLTHSIYGVYTNDLTKGLGWMAIAVVIFGKWRPWGILGGALIFGAANALQFRLQSLGFPLPYQILLMLPFVVTLIITIFFVRGGSGPSSLTEPYLRSEQ
jgi:simple sugar transport system permease protein